MIRGGNGNLVATTGRVGYSLVDAAYIVAAANEAPALARRVLELEAALEQAHDRMDRAFGHVFPDMTADDRGEIAQSLWFVMKEIDALLPAAPETEESPR